MNGTGNDCLEVKPDHLKVAKFANGFRFFAFHFPGISLVRGFKQASKSGWLFCFSVHVSLAGEKARFLAENSAIRELIALLRASQIVRDH